MAPERQFRTERIAAINARGNACYPLEVDRTPVVGIHHAEVPQLGSLVDIRHAWGRQLDQCLREGMLGRRLWQWAAAH